MGEPQLTVLRAAGSAVRESLLVEFWDHKGCRRLNPGWPRVREAPVILMLCKATACYTNAVAPELLF